MRSGLWVYSTTAQMWAQAGDEGRKSDCVRETDVARTRVRQADDGAEVVRTEGRRYIEWHSFSAALPCFQHSNYHTHTNRQNMIQHPGRTLPEECTEMSREDVGKTKEGGIIT